MSLADIPTALDALRAGRPIIVVDDEGRENEGDLIIAAQFASQEWMAFMVRHSSGFICAPMTHEIADRLELPVMVLNVPHVDVNFFRVKPEALAAFVSQWEYRSSLSNWESDELLKMADLVYTGRFDLNPARNTREKLLLPLKDIAPLTVRGLYRGHESGRAVQL